MRSKWYRSLLLFLSIWILLLPGIGSLETEMEEEKCNERELQAFTHGSSTYMSYGYSYYSKGKHGGYHKNKCYRILFKSTYSKDVIKMEVVDNDMQEMYRGRCQDRVTMYDGGTTLSPILKVFCGTEMPTVESTYNQILLVFETDDYESRNYRGFKIKYISIDRGGFEAYKASASSSSTGIIIASIIPGVIIYSILMVVVYRRCKYNQQIRRNLAASGHTPEDLRVAMVTMLEQTRQGQLNVSRRGPEGIQESLRNLMDQNAAMRNGISTTEGQRGRVRHPAGDVRTNASSQNISMIPLETSESSMPFLPNDGSDQNNGYYSHPSNNNITTNNNTAANLNYQAGYPVPGYSPDPTGVYYAGDVDEHGMLHPANGGSPYYPPPGSLPTSLPNPIYTNHPHLDVEDDLRSRSSGRRSPHGSGRNSPRGRYSPSRSRTSSSSHRPNQRQARGHGHHGSLSQLNMEGSTLTYYGMVDGNASDNGNSSSIPINNVDRSPNQRANDIQLPSAHEREPPSYASVEEAPPPSYDDVALGNYTPLPNS